MLCIACYKKLAPETLLLPYFIYFVLLLQTDADRRFLAAKGSVPIGIGKNSHIKRAIIDKNARIGDNVKVIFLFQIFFFLFGLILSSSET